MDVAECRKIQEVVVSQSLEQTVVVCRRTLEVVGSQPLEQTAEREDFKYDQHCDESSSRVLIALDAVWQM